MSMVLLGVVAFVAALEYAQVVLAPVFLSVVIGLMFGPVADRIERVGIPPWISGIAVVLMFVALIGIAITGFAVPLSDWLEKLPAIWARLQSELTSWRGAIASVAGLQEQLRAAMGQPGGMRVNVEDNSAVESVVFFAPALMAQIVLFLASLYFFIATRVRIRAAVLAWCFGRHLRWRIARIFRDVEAMVSGYLLSITGVNLVLAVAVAGVFYALGIPSPLLWGMLAGVLNYVIYIGPAIMLLILTGVGLATADNPLGIMTPPLAYLALNLMEAQFVTPHVIGRTAALNPFAVFLSLAFWIWLWGPVGGFIAVPSLLVVNAILSNSLPPAVSRARAARVRPASAAF
ncbi:AI-2E family transporter [Breoghania sp. L-A4]|nr:AI-2E family transporter [Breoghania sp. L-A4]